MEPSADLRAFGDQEAALLARGDVDGATELNVRMWVRPDVDDETRQLFREMQSNAFRILLAAGDDVHEQDVAIDLGHISGPVTVVTGGRDVEWFRATGDYLAAGLPRADRIELPWAGHLPNLERPAETTELIRRSIRA